jgi:hypothetical protein
LALRANFLDGFDDDLGGETAVSAYLDTVKMLDPIFLPKPKRLSNAQESGKPLSWNKC